MLLWTICINSFAAMNVIPNLNFGKVSNTKKSLIQPNLKPIDHHYDTIMDFMKATSYPADSQALDFILENRYLDSVSDHQRNFYSPNPLVHKSNKKYKALDKNIRQKYSDAISDPLNKDSLQFIQSNFNHLQNSPYALLESFYMLAIEKALKNPMHKNAQTVMDDWINFEQETKIHSQEFLVNKLSIFNDKKLDFLRALRDPSKIHFPIKFQLNSQYYILSRIQEMSAVGNTFEACLTSSPNQKLLIKFTNLEFLNDLSRFRNDIKVLKKLKRLIDYDAKQLISVQPKMDGSPFFTVMHRESYNPSRFARRKADYQNLVKVFYNQTGMVHFGISPDNVIVSSRGKYSILNFDDTLDLKTKPLNEHEEFLKKSNQVADENFQVYYSYLKQWFLEESKKNQNI